ncbi:MAG: sel1 repeat family protein [Akkermansia sp.]|nr:sel1 repeat family protein [Akkermansia sp.]
MSIASPEEDYTKAKAHMEAKEMPAALKLLQNAAEEGHADAQYELGMCCMTGNGTEKNLKKAVEWFQRAAFYQHAEAELRLAICFGKGLGIEKNIAQALYWLENSGKHGNKRAGKQYTKLYDKLITNAQKSPRSQADMGEYHYLLDKKEDARKWFDKAAAQKDCPAKVFYYLWDMSSDKYYDASAIALLSKSAQKGYAQAQDTYAGMILDQGGDMEKVFKLRLQAAEQGYQPAMHNVSVHYSRGDGVKANKEESKRWEELADDPYMAAKSMIGNPQTTRKLYRKAAELGNRDALRELAIMYAAGRGGPKDYDAARKMYKLYCIKQKINVERNLKEFEHSYLK